MSTLTDTVMNTLIDTVRALPRGEEPAKVAVIDPEVGQFVWGFSRGNWRVVRIAKVGPKNVTVEYVTEGGIKSAQDRMDRYRVMDAEANRDRALALYSDYLAKGYRTQEQYDDAIVRVHEDYERTLHAIEEAKARNLAHFVGATSKIIKRGEIRAI